MSIESEKSSERLAALIVDALQHAGIVSHTEFAIQALPDHCTMNDIRYLLYVRDKIAEGLADIEAGRVVSREEAERRIHSGWRPSRFNASACSNDNNSLT